jgi:hypothetical protein
MNASLRCAGGICVLRAGSDRRWVAVRPLLAPLRHADVPCECPLLGVDRKWLVDSQNDAIDPIRSAPGKLAKNRR